MAGETRVRGDVLRTPVTLHPAHGDTGDGPAFGPDLTVRGQVKRRREYSTDSTGSTLTVWATVRIRPTVTVAGATGPRPPEPGDEVTVNGLRRRIASVEPVQGRGTAVAAYDLTAGA